MYNLSNLETSPNCFFSVDPKGGQYREVALYLYIRKYVLTYVRMYMRTYRYVFLEVDFLVKT